MRTSNPVAIQRFLIGCIFDGSAPIAIGPAKFIRCVKRASLLTLLIVSASLQAQTSPTLSTTGKEVTVTASKFSESTTSATRQVTVIDSATVARAATGDLAQLLQEQLGVYVNGAYANPGLNKSLNTRGGGSQYTLILLDGVPVTDPSALGGVIDLRLISLEGIERIEIIRGPQSLLYGSDAVAGVINLISKRAPDGKRLGLSANLSAGSLSTLQAGGALSFNNDLLNGVVSTDYYRTDGISEALAPAGTPEYEKDGATRTNVNMKLNLTPTGKMSYGLSTRISEFDGDYDAGAFQDADNTYTNQLLNLGLNADYRGDNLKVSGRYGVTRTSREFASGFGAFDFAGTSHQTDVFGAYTAGEKLEFLGGIQGRFESLDNGMDDVENPEANSISPYLRAAYELTEDLTAEAGYRFTSHSAYGGQSNYSLALAWRVAPAFTARTSVASALLNPVLDQLYGQFGANDDLQPQTSTSFELGGDYRKEDGTMTASASVFHRVIDEIIFYGFDGYDNGDKQRDLGFEIGGTAVVFPKLKIEVGYSFVDGKRLTDGPVKPSQTFFRRPAFKANTAILYTPVDNLLLRLSIQSVSERDDFFFDDTFTQVPVKLEPYTLANFFAEYRIQEGRYRIFTDIKNLSNTDFVEVTGFGTVGFNARVGVGIKL